jgi:hypothetical protein
VIVTLSGFPRPFVFDGGQTTVSGLALSEASVSYQFGIVAPPGISSVPVQVIALGRTIALGDSSTDLGFVLQGPGVPQDDVFTQVSACGPGGPLCSGVPSSASLDFNATFNLETNTAYDVTIEDVQSFTCLTGLAGGSCGSSGNYSNFLDPYIAVDPAFLASHPGVVLTLSPGVGNEPVSMAAPEPATIALLGASLAGVAFPVRRRRQRRFERRASHAIASS